MRGDGRQKNKENLHQRDSSSYLFRLFSLVFIPLQQTIGPISSHRWTMNYLTVFSFFSKTEALALWLVSRSRIAWLYLDDGRQLGGRETQPGNFIGRREKNKRPSVPPSRANELLNGVASYAKLLLSSKHSVSLSVSTLVGVPREWTLD